MAHIATSDQGTATISQRPRTCSLPTNAVLRRVRIGYSDDELCENAIANLNSLVRAARETNASRSAVLARRALRYRNKLEHAQSANVDDPTFDVAAFMGVTWCKVPNVESSE